MQLHDSEKVRYTDLHLLAALNTAVGEIRRVRPDIADIQVDIPNFPYVGNSINDGTRVPVDDMYYGPIISFVVGWAELIDDEFTVDGRANTLLTRFTQQLVAGG